MSAQPLPDVGDWIQSAPWRGRKVSLILTGDVFRQASDLVGKRAILESQTGRVLVLWTGQYTTHARIIHTAEERADVLEKLA